MCKVDTEKELAKYGKEQITKATQAVNEWWKNEKTRQGYGYETAILHQLSIQSI